MKTMMTGRGKTPIKPYRNSGYWSSPTPSIPTKVREQQVLAILSVAEDHTILKHRIVSKPHRKWAHIPGTISERELQDMVRRGLVRVLRRKNHLAGRYHIKWTQIQLVKKPEITDSENTGGPYAKRRAALQELRERNG